MCSPQAFMVSLASIQGAVQFAGQQRQAKQQEAYQRQAQAAERQRFLQEQTSMRMRQAQEQEAVGREMEQLSLRTRQAISRTKENPYAAALADDYLRQEGAIRASLLRQQELGGIATGLGLEQAGFATQQRQIGINQPISKPGFLEGALGVASGAMSGYSTGLQMQSMMGGGGTTRALQSYTAPRAIGRSNVKIGGGYKIL